MAGNIYLYLDGIPGESTAKDFQNWIDVASFSVATTMEIDKDERVAGGGGISGAADGEDFSIETKMSVATPVLLQCCALGALIPQGKIIQSNSVGKEIVPVSDYSFGEAIISQVSVDVSGGGIPNVSMSINYGSIVWQYHCYNHHDAADKVASLFRTWNVLASSPDMAGTGAIAAHSSIKIDKPGRYKASGKANFNTASPVDMPKK